MDFRVRTAMVFLATLAVVGPLMLAEEPASVIAESPHQAVDSRAEFARLIWAVMETIESEQISPPSRWEFFGRIVPVLTGYDRGASNDAVDEFHQCLVVDFLRCQTADELYKALEQIKSGNLIERFMEEFGRKSEDDRAGFNLIRDKDHEVEEQFRNNRYVGLGVATSMDKENLYPSFVQILPGGPADRSGLEAGTVVYEVDGRSVENVPLSTFVDWLRGPQGTDVTLKISSPKSPETRSITITRGVVRFDSLKSKDFATLNRNNLQFDASDPIGWISIRDITASTLHELRSMESWVGETRIRALILDFRQTRTAENLHQGLLVADSFLNGGAIWEQSDRHSEGCLEMADRECLFRDIPLVVIVGESTGPIPCAIAAALQDAGRATIVGTSPQFRGLVQSTIKLPNLPFSLVIKTTRLTRSRHDHRWPLLPDIETGGPRQDFSEMVARSMPRQIQLLVAGNQARETLPGRVAGNPGHVTNGRITTRETADQAAVRIARERIAGIPSGKGSIHQSKQSSKPQDNPK